VELPDPDLVDAGLRCIAYDRRGHGRSDRPGHGYDVDTLADDLAALIAHLDLCDATLVGHSFGCDEIARYVSRHGAGRVARAVFLAPTLPYLAKAADNPDGVPKSRLEANAATLKQDVPKWCADNAPPFFGVDSRVSPGMTDWVMRQIVDTPLTTLIETMRANTETDFRAELPNFRVPTLIVHGDADASAPLAITGRKTAALVTGSRLVVYEGAGHGLFASEHPRLNRDLLAFIQG
jgi:non-heme chloroperoxidase